MSPKNSCVSALLTVALLLISFSGNAVAQSHKSTHKAADKKSDRHAKEARKETKTTHDRDAKNTKAKAKDDRSARNSKANKKDDKRDKTSAKNVKDKKESRSEARRAEAERRRKEEERRQTIIAEQRRREAAAREARARKLAFERGLRTETVANIARDKTEGEDLKIRQAAISALGNRAGSVVVMEAQTGKVLTIVNQDWAIRSSIRPCSTIKLVTGVAGLNEGVISKEDGSVKNAATRRHLDDAVAFSDNSYFQRVGASLGNQKLVEYGKMLGLAQPTGVNLDGEVPGRLPYNNNNARIYSHGDDTEVTTIQLAVLASAITNGGKRVLPRIPRNEVEQAKFQTFYKATVDLPQTNVRRMIPGMMGAAEYGTAHRGVDASLGIAGKTGSCIDKGSWVGLFASVAPIENPKYAVAVITRGQSERGKYAAAVAGQVYKALAAGIVRTDRNLAQTEFHLKPKNSIEIRTAAATAATAEDDDDDNNGAATQNTANTLTSQDGDVPTVVIPNTSKPVYTQKNVPSTTPKKLVTRTGDSKPVFPPVVITYDRSGKPKRPPVENPQ